MLIITFYSRHLLIRRLNNLFICFAVGAGASAAHVYFAPYVLVCTAFYSLVRFDFKVIKVWQVLAIANVHKIYCNYLLFLSRSLVLYLSNNAMTHILWSVPYGIQHSAAQQVFGVDLNMFDLQSVVWTGFIKKSIC